MFVSKVKHGWTDMTHTSNIRFMHYAHKNNNGIILINTPPPPPAKMF
jgi:hypothetical protein